ncbi:MAG: hypothetical protein ABIR24_03855 [Verrucomicrobiota bacterium]
MSSKFLVGVARKIITPPPGVELAGLGYYLNRTWARLRDDLTATAFVIEDETGRCVALIALDLMYNDATFTRSIREQISLQTNISPDGICVNCSHSHNAPTAGLIRGAGERNEAYLKFAARQAAGAAIEAWQKRQPAKIFVGKGELSGMTFNRTRENGPVDTRVSVLRADSIAGKPLVVAVNFHSHCTAHMEIDLHAVSRDWPGEVVEQIEAASPGATALYFQGTCGDVNFRREFNGTEKRFEPAKAITKVALDALTNSRPIEQTGVAAICRKVSLPTRRWTEEEISRDREEGLYRLKTGDTTGWMGGIAHNAVGLPERLPLRYDGSVEKTVAALSRFAVEWTDEILPVINSRPEILETEIQALRIGDIYFSANPSELFTTLGLDLRQCWPHEDLFMLSYANGSIGYLPDAHDIERKTYAAVQSPKFTGQFPFTDKSGITMIRALENALRELGRRKENLAAI